MSWMYLRLTTRVLTFCVAVSSASAPSAVNARGRILYFLIWCARASGLLTASISDQSHLLKTSCRARSS